MANNFEEQFLLMLVPYDHTSVSYYPSSVPKLGGTPIPINPFKNADAWTQATRNDILKISKTKVGSLLLRSIKFHGQVVTIRPKDVNECNSGTFEGDTIFNKNNLQVGTGADIIFNPDTYLVGGKCEARHLQMGGFHIESDETLLHELVHALRKVSGKENPTAIGKGLSFYGYNEEFNAVLVQGIYASERRKPVRSSHFHHFEIDKELNSSMKFFKSSSETFHYVERFCQENPGFTRAFTNIDANFNPLNAYYECREQVKELSKSATAHRRDVMLPIVKATLDFLKKEFN